MTFKLFLLRIKSLFFLLTVLCWISLDIISCEPGCWRSLIREELSNKIKPYMMVSFDSCLPASSNCLIAHSLLFSLKILWLQGNSISVVVKQLEHIALSCRLCLAGWGRVGARTKMTRAPSHLQAPLRKHPWLECLSSKYWFWITLATPFYIPRAGWRNKSLTVNSGFAFFSFRHSGQVKKGYRAVNHHFLRNVHTKCVYLLKPHL